MDTPIRWPDGKRFAFTVFDDTDGARLDNISEVYALLRDVGLRTTKSAWPLPGRDPSQCTATTCEDGRYVDWLRSLQGDGFEIGWHGATFHSSVRGETIRGLETFSRLFGADPVVMSNHKSNVENLYWGSLRVSGLHRLAYNLLTRYRKHGRFLGHVESEYFWGDLCKSRIKFVRNFDFLDTNTLKMCPVMPYHDPSRPLVNYWFASCDGPDVETYNRRLSEANQDRLEEEGGACVMYTHFARGFHTQGRLNPRFRELMERLAGKGGWFVPTSRLLEYLLEVRGHRVISRTERERLERRWLWERLQVALGQTGAAEARTAGPLPSGSDHQLVVS